MQPENETNPQANNPRLARIEQFLLDPDKVIFESLDRFEDATNQLVAILEGLNLAELETLAGTDGVTPVRGVDYMTDADIAALESFILDNLPVEDVDFPSMPTVQGYVADAQANLEAFLAAEVAKIPRIKGEKGDKGEHGSRDTGLDIIKKIRGVNKNQGLRPKDIRGLESALNTLSEHSTEIEGLWAAVNDFKVVFPATPQASESVAGVTEVAAGTGISVTGTAAVPIVNLDAASIASLALADSALQNITGLITAGANITITGTGTAGDPYAIAAAGGAVGGQVDSVVGTAGEVVVDATDPVNPVVSLATAITDAVALANSAVQNLADLGITATAAELNLLDGVTATTAEINYIDGVTSNIQTQLNAKGDVITGAATTIVSTDLAVDRALVSSATGKVAVSAVTAAELAFLDGVTSNIQTQLDAKADEATLTAHIADVANPHVVTATQVGLGNVNNTSDANKPVSTAQQTALGLKASLTGAETLTNKRVQPRTASSTSNANLTPDLSSANVYYRTTQTTGLTINAPTGTPVIGETILIYLDAAADRTLTMNATYIPFGAAFPASITAGTTLMLSAQYNGTNWKTLWANQII